MLTQENIVNVYNHIQDSYSKVMYENRLLYSLTGDKRHLMNVIKMTEEGSDFIQKLYNGNKCLIFGAGSRGKEIFSDYKDVQFECFVDNKPIASSYCGLPVISFDNYLEHYKTANIVISSWFYHKEIYQQLKKSGIDDSYIINAGKIIDDMSKKQYFDLPEFKENQAEEESFVDAGCFDGASSLAFLEWAGEKGKNIYAFEADPKNADLCKENFEKKIRPVNSIRVGVYSVGLWNRKETLCFQATAYPGSHISNEGNTYIEVDCLDNILSGEPVTFIKMDIEGAEFNALLGAEKLIREYKPKLAICLYHKPEDIWELPSLCLEMNPDYKFYLRHYSLTNDDTVLYAL